MPESTLARPSDPGAEEADVPPTVSCAVCRRQDCSGCEAPRGHPLSATSLEWEGKNGSWTRRLWFTALASSTQPAKIFGALPDGRVRSALAFALLAEIMAIGSLGSVLALAALAVAPDLSARILTAPAFLAGALGLLVGLSLLMVALHIVWGLCVELGARNSGAPARFRQGMRFGLYACGWDLLTSPAGVVEGLLSRGFVHAWHPIVQAIRVPRAALRAYVEDYRHLDGQAQRRGVQLSIAVLGAMMLSILVAVLLAILHFAELLG